ncbi:hypothetical protein [Rhizobium sp. BT-226]|uniref:hypothetical protein n=1 Tax=Rhizobium sp. BT-226 TaxID=2986922 RepID=UPI0021F7AC93|nr:hypothetical protein [Rhizobium sp. BT-226]MCW0021430.1 hypothetical protein [Rhizobium sp. BT-226]
MNDKKANFFHVIGYSQPVNSLREHPNCADQNIYVVGCDGYWVWENNEPVCISGKGLGWLKHFCKYAAARVEGIDYEVGRRMAQRLFDEVVGLLTG